MLDWWHQRLTRENAGRVYCCEEKQETVESIGAIVYGPLTLSNGDGKKKANVKRRGPTFQSIDFFKEIIVFFYFILFGKNHNLYT